MTIVDWQSPHITLDLLYSQSPHLPNISNIGLTSTKVAAASLGLHDLALVENVADSIAFHKSHWDLGPTSGGKKKIDTNSI